MRRTLPLLASAALALAFAAPAAPAGAASSQPATYRGSKLIATKSNAWCSEMRGNANALGLAGKKLVLKAAANPKKNQFVFETAKEQAPLVMEIDPTAGVSVLVTGGSGPGDHSVLVELDPTKWKAGGTAAKPSWKYKDKTGARGGVREALLQRGRFVLKARGASWQFAPDGLDQAVTVHLQLGNQWYCSTFGGTVDKNDTSQYRARNAEAPTTCADQMCGNGVQEIGEQCDDGNLVPADGCENACLAGECEGDAFGSTFEAIQSVVFDTYGCSSNLCHGEFDPDTGEAIGDHESGLYLLPTAAANFPTGNPQGLAEVLRKNHEALLTLAPANNQFFEHFAVEGDSKTSLLYQVLFKKTHCAAGAPNPPAECDDLDAVIESDGMPDGPFALTVAEVEAVDLWLRGGAPLEGVVGGTPERLDSCLPPATPLKIDPPPAPGAGNGIQLRSSAWSLPQQSENEICFPTYYDFTQTNLIPVDQQIDCPTDGEGNDVFGPANHSHKCFRWHKQLLLQDPQSHHSIIHLYTGVAGVGDAGWGAWTYKHDEVDHPQNGQPCNPLEVDPATGQNFACSGEPVRSAACLQYGPPDFSAGGIGGGGAGTAPQFSGSQETHYEQELADGVYSIQPMTGIVVWNSHAFNLTDGDTTMNQYLNLWLAGPDDQLYQTEQIFDASEIFWKPFPPLPPYPSVPAFETHEFCRTWTAPVGAKIFWLSSHTHRHGVRWRTYGPPNAPCQTANPACVAPETDERLIYYSTVYNDPIQLEIDPPLHITDPDAEDRTFLFCGLYDNGSTPASPSVKRHSLSPEPPLIFDLFPIGGPCADAEKSCISPNPAKRGQLCNAEAEPDRFCDSAPGAMDGLCDACPLRGGFTTEDEMFILLGNYFVE